MLSFGQVTASSTWHVFWTQYIYILQ